MNKIFIIIITLCVGIFIMLTITSFLVLKNSGYLQGKKEVDQSMKVKLEECDRWIALETKERERFPPQSMETGYEAYP